MQFFHKVLRLQPRDSELSVSYEIIGESCETFDSSPRRLTSSASTGTFTKAA